MTRTIEAVEPPSFIRNPEQDYLGTWEAPVAVMGPLRLDLWQVGFGSRAELAYRLTMPKPEDPAEAAMAHLRIALETHSWRAVHAAMDTLSGELRGTVTIEGREYRPAPSLTIDSDESAGGLVGFFAAYADPRSGAERPDDLTTMQIEALEAHADDLAVWAMELEGD
jgi:hypothetical protein